MTNGERFPTALARAEAFDAFCSAQGKCEECPLQAPEEGLNLCAFMWLELEYEPHVEPCPFCGGELEFSTLGPLDDGTVHQVHCQRCKYASRECHTDAEAIDAHNRVARAVREAAK